MATRRTRCVDSPSFGYPQRYISSLCQEQDENDIVAMHGDENVKLTSSEEDQRLKNAATIGTALMVVNSQRALVLL